MPNIPPGYWHDLLTGDKTRASRRYHTCGARASFSPHSTRFRLQHDHIDARLEKHCRRGKAGESRPDNDDPTPSVDAALMSSPVPGAGAALTRASLLHHGAAGPAAGLLSGCSCPRRGDTLRCRGSGPITQLPEGLGRPIERPFAHAKNHVRASATKSGCRPNRGPRLPPSRVTA